MSKKKTKLTKELMEDNNITNVEGLQSILKEMLKHGIEALLELKLNDELGYNRYSIYVLI